MSLNIEIGDYKITSDDRQMIISRKKLVDPTKSPNWEAMKAKGKSAEIREEWEEVAYFRHIENVIKYLAQRVVLDSDATTLKELHGELSAFYRQIRRLLND